MKSCAMANYYSGSGQTFLVKKVTESGELSCSWDGTTNTKTYTKVAIHAMCVRKKAVCRQ